MRALINCSVLYCHPEKWNKKIAHDSDRTPVLTVRPLFLFPFDLALELYLSVISGFFFFTLILNNSVGQRRLEMYFLTNKPPRLLFPCPKNSHSSRWAGKHIFHP